MNMVRIAFIILALSLTMNKSMAESYYCEGDTKNPFRVEYDPKVNSCKSFYNCDEFKKDKKIIQFCKEQKNYNMCMTNLIKDCQNQYKECMELEQAAANLYKKGKCKKLITKEYIQNSQHCSDKYLDGKKIFSGCFGDDNMTIKSY